MRKERKLKSESRAYDNDTEPAPFHFNNGQPAGRPEAKLPALRSGAGGFLFALSRFCGLFHFRQPSRRPAAALTPASSEALKAQNRLFNLLALRAQILQHFVDVHTKQPQR